MKLIDRSIRDRLIADSICDMIWEIDYVTKEFHVSSTWKRFLGYEEEEYDKCINCWQDIVHPEDQKRVTELLNEHIEDKTNIFSAKYRVRTKNGSYKWVAGRAKAYKDCSGEVTYIAGFHTDISAHVALEESEDKYKTLFNSVKDAIFLVKYNDITMEDEFVDVNDAAAELIGCGKIELIGKSIDYIRPENISYKKTTCIGRSMNNRNYFFQTAVSTKTRGIVPVEISTGNLKIEGKSLYLAVVRDISNWLDAEKALKEERELNKNIVNLSPNGAFIHDNGKIVYTNKKGIELFKAHNMEELIGKDILDFLPSDFRAEGRERLNRAQRGEVAEPVEVVVKGLDGSTLTAEVSTAYMPSKSGTLALSYFKDITAMKSIYEENKKLLEQTLEYDKLKTEFFANISHELRTPLNIILSSIQLLNFTYKQCGDSKGQCFLLLNKYIEVMKQNSYRLLKLINNLIDITRIDKGFYNTNLRNNNIVETIEEVVLSVVPYVESRGMELVFDTDFEEMNMAFDEDKIERIMLNLISNAIKFTGSGGKINVNLKEKGGRLIISVRDNGRGIPEDKLSLIFERFRQVDEVLTKRAEGSGIGLSIVKALVVAHNGEISVKSQVGKGSEFLVEIPITKLEGECFSEIITNIPNIEQNKIERINIELADIDI